jgi:predicted MFS family arabinose efflux permease
LSHPSKSKVLYLSFALSLAAAVSIGITRFSYGLLLPPMRSDLGWSYSTAGTVNTINALGYFLGAMVTPIILKRAGGVTLLLFGMFLSSLFMTFCGFFKDTEILLFLRLGSGISSALIFISGGLLSARLGSLLHERAGLILGLYYGGTGTGIFFSALTIPYVLHIFSGEASSWRYGWWAMGALCAFSMILLWKPMEELRALGLSTPPESKEGENSHVEWVKIRGALLGYGMFGVGYIGYMTFVIALLKEKGVEPIFITLFYSLLGVSTIAGGKIWSTLLDRAKAGGAIATLNGLLGFSVLLPVLTLHPIAILVSGGVFGSIFLSVVASTTAFVRHNLNPSVWTKGITGFTIIFALGQIIGPFIVGWISDGDGGIERGLVFSAISLWVGALFAWSQKKIQ